MFVLLFLLSSVWSQSIVQQTSLLLWPSNNTMTYDLTQVGFSIDEGGDAVIVAGSNAVASTAMSSFSSSADFSLFASSSDKVMTVGFLCPKSVYVVAYYGCSATTLSVKNNLSVVKERISSPNSSCYAFSQAYPVDGPGWGSSSLWWLGDMANNWVYQFSCLTMDFVPGSGHAFDFKQQGNSMVGYNLPYLQDEVRKERAQSTRVTFVFLLEQLLLLFFVLAFRRGLFLAARQQIRLYFD